MSSSALEEPAPNYATRGPGLIACSVVLLIIPSITVFIRLWSRATSRTKFWWDDFMVLSTLLFSHLLLATTLKLVSLGLGKHTWMIPLKNVKPTLTWQLLSLTWYTIAITLLKLSALTLYARIFRVEIITRLVLWGVGALALAWGIGISIEPWTNCRPVCQNRSKWYIAAGTINLLFDLVVLLIPMPLIWALNLQLKKKVLLSMVFLLGYW
jgi:hypothetical protein